MNQVVLKFAMAAVLAGSVTVGAGPAGAAGGVVFVGTAHIDCFGCGGSPCDATLTVAGTVGTSVVAGGVATTACYAYEPADVLCWITGTASGRVEGAANVDFNWTRVGEFAVITTTGDIDGSGQATFHITSPQGIPCGQEVYADVAGGLGGT